jgi:hypothetical protein
MLVLGPTLSFTTARLRGVFVYPRSGGHCLCPNFLRRTRVAGFSRQHKETRRVQRSDETGDEPGLTGPLAGPGAEPVTTGKLPTHAFRERIRRASVAAQAVEMAPLEIPSSPPSVNSSLPPEHSGVRDRPNEPPHELSATTLPPPVFLSPPNGSRPTPRAWPFAPPGEGTPRKRTLQATQMGLGSPSSSPPPPPAPLGNAVPAKPRSRTPPLPAPALLAAPAPNAPVTSATLPGRHKKPASSPLPAADANAASVQDASYFLSESSAYERAIERTADAGHAHRPSLLRSPALSTDAGRYSTHDVSAEYIESASGQEQQQRQEQDDPPASTEANDSSHLGDDPLSRARRYTPKQRPAHRRGRQHEAIRTSPGGRSKDVSARERETPASSPERRTLGPDSDVSAQSAAPAAGSPQSSKANDVQSALVRTLPERPARITIPDRPLAARPSKPPGSPSQYPLPLPEAPTTNPRLAGKPRAAGDSVTSYPPSSRAAQSAAITLRKTAQGHAPPSTYEPLPRDRAGFDAFMQQRAAAARSSGGRTNWKDQETLLVPRESLSPKSPMLRAARLDRLPFMPVAAVIALLVIGAATFWLRRQAAETVSVHAVPISSTGSVEAPAVPTTLIATEPSGAELLLGGAVLGNTPVAVARPVQNDETYFLRMRGFESQLVRVSPQSGAAIRVTMVPLAPNRAPLSAAPVSP